LRTELKNIRIDERYVPIEVWTVSELSAATDDIFAVPTTLSSGAQYFSGSVAWTSTVQRQDSEGGYYPTGDVTIVASMTEKTKVTQENSYLVVEDVSVKMSRIVDAAETDEMVIYCERYQP
jgi:hypothetical protein